MKILPDITSMKCSRLAELKENYTVVTFNENNNVALSFVETDKSNFDILSDLVECKAYATALLYLNENYILSDKHSSLLENANINDYYSDCEKLLSKNIKIVEEVGIPLTDINGYKIFEGNGYILRGNGKKKIYESFNNEIDLEDITLDYLRDREYDQFIKGMIMCPECGAILDKEQAEFEDEEEYDVDTYAGFDRYYTETKTKIVDKAICSECKYAGEIEEFYPASVDYLFSAPNAEELVPGISTLEEDTLNEDGEGTQCDDIAPKKDQELGINIPTTTSKKKYYDVLIDMDESELPIINKGFMKNSKGQYQRGNYILVKEGDKYLAIHKNKLIEEVNGQLEIDNKGLPVLPRPYYISKRNDKRYQITSSHPYDLTDYSWAVSFNDDINSNWKVIDPAEQDRQDMVNGYSEPYIVKGWNEALELMKKIDSTKESHIDRT